MDALVHAPEIDRKGLTWFNVPGPLNIAALRGRVVILDFWTFCCINCMHVLATLRRVEEMFPKEVVVIGVHSPKFTAERDPANVAAAIARYGIAHPVVHDPDMVLWREYAVRAWPTLVFIGPFGRLLGQSAGEPDPDRMIAAIQELLREAKRQGKLEPKPFKLLAPPGGGLHLSFPGKIKPLKGGAKQWTLADSGHHQIVLLDDFGHTLRRFGSGKPGFDDGTADSATFHAPQGLVADYDAIYVADTGNHAVRRIDRATGQVDTLAGTGLRGPVLRGETPARETALASVWDLEWAGSQLYFANAGTHQIGVLDLRKNTVAVLAGSGAEAITDGPAESAALAQPSGLALAADALYFADSETSAVRCVRLGRSPSVQTLVGSGLFEFGHRNGPFASARFQHPLGLAWQAGRVVVADSYNGALRVLDLERRTVDDLDGGSFTCADPMCLSAGEPAGVTADGPDRLLVADTNNHRILEYRLATKTYRTWAD